MFSKTSTAKFAIIMTVVISLSIIVSVVLCQVFKNTNSGNISASELPVLNYQETPVSSGGSISNPPLTATGGSFTQASGEQAGTYYLTAVEDANYTFAYWKTTSGIKVSGDRKILVTSTSGYEPVFIANTNVSYINSLEDMRNDIVNANTSGKMYVLTANVNLGYGAWTPLGYASGSATGTAAAFQGVFDGNGYKIYGLNISSLSVNAALFASVSDGVIKNVTISDGSISTSGNIAGGIAGQIVNSLVSRCSNYASVTSTKSDGIAGGIVGSSGSTKSTLYCNNNYGSVAGYKSEGILGQNAANSGVPSCDLFRNHSVAGVSN